VPVGATQEQIKNAYKQKSLLWDPDKNPDYQAGQAFALIAWAYDQLK
jgi:curved DNA-binding protein CbpA